MTAPSSIARIKVVLDDVAPTVMRRLEVPFSIKLDQLHIVLQVALGWTNSHLFEFRIKGTGFGIPNPDYGFGNGPQDARKAKLSDIIEDTGAKSFKHLKSVNIGGREETVVSAEGIYAMARNTITPAAREFVKLVEMKKSEVLARTPGISDGNAAQDAVLFAVGQMGFSAKYV